MLVLSYVVLMFYYADVCVVFVSCFISSLRATSRIK